MKNTAIITFIGLIISLSTTWAHAQSKPADGSVGISASFQNNQTSILFPIWTSNHTVIAPVIGIYHETDVVTTLSLGVKPRFYRKLGSNFASYLGFQGLIQHQSPEVGDNQTDFLIGGNGGGEYFFSPHFSMGVEGQLNFSIREDRNDVFSTGAALIGTYYF